MIGLRAKLSQGRTLEKLGIARATFYRWCDRYQIGEPEALDARIPGRIVLEPQTQDYPKIVDCYTGDKPHSCWSFTHFDGASFSNRRMIRRWSIALDFEKSNSPKELFLWRPQMLKTFVKGRQLANFALKLFELSWSKG